MPGHVPTPATKAEELIEKLNMIALGAEVDDLVLRRISQEAQRAMPAGPAEAHTVLGAVAALQGHAEDVRKHFEIALQQSLHSGWVYSNYSSALLNLGETGEAFALAKQAFEKTPGDLSALGNLVGVALQAAHFREAATLQKRFHRLSPDRPQPDKSLAQMLGDAVDRGAFQEESVQEVLQVVHEILRTEGIRRLGHSTLMADETCPDSFLHEIPIFASPDRAAELNEVLANRLAAQPDLMADPGTRFVPMFIGVHVDGGHSTRAV